MPETERTPDYELVHLDRKIVLKNVLFESSEKLYVVKSALSRFGARVGVIGSSRRKMLGRTVKVEGLSK